MRVLAVVVIAASGCVRAPAKAECPPITAGDLVVTEIRGNTDTTLGPWVELYNATGDSVDLLGTKVRFRKLDGSAETDVIVRRSLEVAPAGYAVLGLFPDDDSRPSFVDYGFAADFPNSWLASGAINVEACGETVDRVIYDSLPDTGTLSLGTQPPDAAANDFDMNWCTDATGTPQQPNNPCP